MGGEAGLVDEWWAGIESLVIGGGGEGNAGC